MFKMNLAKILRIDNEFLFNLTSIPQRIIFYIDQELNYVNKSMENKKFETYKTKKLDV